MNQPEEKKKRRFIPWGNKKDGEASAPDEATAENPNPQQPNQASTTSNTPRPEEKNEPEKKPGFLSKMGFGGKSSETEQPPAVDPPQDSQQPEANESGNVTTSEPTDESNRFEPASPVEPAPAEPSGPPPSTEQTSSPTEETEPKRGLFSRLTGSGSDAEKPKEDTEKSDKPGFFSRLKSGLTRSSSKLSEGVNGIFTKRKLDDDTLEELEDLLISSDLGVATAAKISASLASSRYDKEISPEEVRQVLAEEIVKVLEPTEQPLTISTTANPHVVLMVGVNGTGKTTTIGKIAAKQKALGKTCVLAAGDTFRAAAIEQLKVWGERTGCPVIAKDLGADAAGVAYEAIELAKAQNADIVLIDTAGRLQNKANLMAELEKIVRVIKKLDETAPHSVLLTLDATTGQNAVSQVEAFKDTAGVTGLVMTKLDGTARGGILVALAEKFALPVHLIGVGEGIDDLQEFRAQDFATALVGNPFGEETDTEIPYESQSISSTPHDL